MAVTTFRGYMILSRVGVGQMSSSAPAETPVQTFKQQANAVTTVVAEVFAPQIHLVLSTTNFMRILL
jgi:hypothetical protein